MSAYLYNPHQQQHHQQFHPMHPHNNNNHHGGRSRRAPRLPSAQNIHKQQFRQVKVVKEPVPENPAMLAYSEKFEWGRSFDLEDDFEFCPGLLTDEEYHIVQSSSSDRSSLSSGSPDSSPLQHQIHPASQVTPALSLASMSNSYNANAASYHQNSLKLHQPSAIRTRNAIPIVNPSTGMRVSSPPSSISPGMMQQTTAARRW